MTVPENDSVIINPRAPLLVPVVVIVEVAKLLISSSFPNITACRHSFLQVPDLGVRFDFRD